MLLGMLSSMRLPLVTLLACSVSGLVAPKARSTEDHVYDVLILGGGVSGIIAAQQLHMAGIENFLVVEARDELGGRMRSFDFHGTTLEYGCNWIEGTESPWSKTGLVNPIWTLAQKHGLVSVYNNWEDVSFYDDTGNHDFSDVYEEIGNYYDDLQVAAGSRIDLRQVDMTARAGFNLVGERPGNNKHAWACEVYDFDWEYAQTPEQTSWIGSSQNWNFTFNPDRGGFSGEDYLVIDQRGFKHLILAEAATFLQESQTMLSAIVKNIAYDSNGVTVTLASDPSTTLRAKYAIVTFSVGVLQNNDVTWTPALPHWKLEAIMSMKMGTYTKIFLKFDHKFWDNSEMGLYADPHKRGYYAVWQSLDQPGFFEGSGIYFVTVMGDEAERIETLTDAQVQAEVMGVIRTMYPKVAVPDPIGIALYRWHSDPLYRGSWSNWPASWYLEHLDNLRDPVDNVYFAGEHTSYRYFGYLQGAYETGKTAGQEVAACLVLGCTPSGSMIGADVQNNNKAFPPWSDFKSA